MAASPSLTGDLLDVGCGNKPYQSLMACEKYIGIDVGTSPHEQNNFNFTFDGTHIPFGDSTFDSVLCTEVLEHAQEPMLLLNEIGRVLKDNGHALFTVPFVIPHHEVPYDFQRYTYYGLKHRLAMANMELAWAKPRGGVLATTVAVMHFAISNSISRRPFADILYFLFFPIFAILILLDKRTIEKNPIPPISLGWQVLAKKIPRK